MRGLPFKVQENEIKEFFQDYNLVDNSILIGKNARNFYTGDGAVLFNDEE